MIDARGGLIMPGMIDTHRHTGASLNRGFGADKSLLEYLSDVFTRFVPALTVDDLHLSSVIGGLEALDAGVTTVLDCGDVTTTRGHAEANIQGLVDSGIRAVYAYGLSDEDYPGVGSGAVAARARLTDVAELKDAGGDLVRVGMSLAHLGTVPFEQTEASIHLADELGMLCCSHTAGLKNSNYINGVRERAHRGLMLPGHVYIHVTNLNDQEWQLIADTGGKASIAPETEMQMGMGMPPFRACMDHGVPVSLSTDTIGSGSADLLSQMRLGLQLQRALDNEESHGRGAIPFRIELTTRDALAWGTRNGADALGLDRTVGTLTIGKAADLVVVSDRRALSPTNDPVGGAVLQSTAADVDLVLVNGEVRKRDGKLVGHDLAGIRARATETLGRITEHVAQTAALTGPQLRAFLADSERQATVHFAEAYTAPERAAD